jgi:pyruvate dehydrogenase E2 component (dihydrolipoamide acetyltransferase)
MEFKLPDLGENIESGDVTQVLVAVGDTVSEGQSVLEIEAGKATMEIPSPAAGTVSALKVAQGDTVSVGQLVMELEEKAGSGKAETPKPESKPEPVVEEKTPEPDLSSEALAKEEPVVEKKAPEPVVEEKPAAAPAPVAEAKPEPAPVPETRNSKLETPQPAQPVSDLRPPTSEAVKPLAVSASPSVRRLARELGVDIHQIPPTGPAGYITQDDVKEYAKRTLSQGGIPVAGPTRVEKMSGVRKATLKHMTHCWTTIPHVTQHDTADITKLELLRKQYAPRAEAAGAKLTMTAIIIKVIASALKKHPKFNCSINPEKSEIIYKDYYNIGIAMDTPKGLLVPVITAGDKKNIVELALELKALAERAREGKLSVTDLKGGTFTFTNLGIIGGSFFTPIVNSPEVAILGSGRAHWESCPDGGEKRFKLPLSLSYDHRIIDGADGARFLKWVIDAMEEPLLLSLEG